VINQFLKRQAPEQIKLKDKNQQPLLSQRKKILALLTGNGSGYSSAWISPESYRKLKAALKNRIRLENEHKREILQKVIKN
jgi:hypothetical protein